LINSQSVMECSIEEEFAYGWGTGKHHEGCNI
jgi:hypothetical protein